MLMTTLIQNQSLSPKTNLTSIIQQWNQFYLKSFTASTYHIQLLVIIFFQFDSMKAGLSILLFYVHDFYENLKTLYSKLVTHNVFDRKSHNER